MKYFAFPLLAFVLTGLTSGCAAMQNGPLLNPKSGPGTPWLCTPPTSMYCGDHTCCPDGTLCKSNPNRCDATPFNGPGDNNEWLGLSKKPQRFPATQATQAP